MYGLIMMYVCLLTTVCSNNFISAHSVWTSHEVCMYVHQKLYVPISVSLHILYGLVIIYVCSSITVCSNNFKSAHSIWASYDVCMFINKCMFQ